MCVRKQFGETLSNSQVPAELSSTDLSNRFQSVKSEIGSYYCRLCSVPAV